MTLSDQDIVNHMESVRYSNAGASMSKMAHLIESIKSAIEHEQICIFMLNDQLRLVIPYMLGDTKDGRMVLHGIQLDSSVSIDDVDGQLVAGQWGFFYLDRIQSGVQVMPSSFRVAHVVARFQAEGFYQAPKFVTTVFAQAKEERQR
jgi:hypothetical protein